MPGRSSWHKSRGIEAETEIEVGRGVDPIQEANPKNPEQSSLVMMGAAQPGKAPPSISLFPGCYLCGDMGLGGGSGGAGSC